MTRIGQIIGGRYRLTHVIGEGAMGEVYRAQVEAAGVRATEVAVKLLRPERSRDPEAVERFLAEVQAMRALSHPSIARVLDTGESQGDDQESSPSVPYVVMELLGGESLRTLLRHHGRVDRGTALAVILPVLEALDAAHRHGIIHRDVKPENIQIRTTPESTGDGVGPRRAQVMVLDFGIAKVVDASIAIGGHNTTIGMVVGTPGYFAPEQAVGETKIDGRVDVFAVGAVLFEMLTGQRAFDGTSPVAIASRVVNEAVPTLAQLHVEAPAELQRLLDRSLAKKAADRFASAHDFALAVAALAPGELGRRILLDSWVASATGTGSALRSSIDGEANADTESSPAHGADTEDTDASREILGAARTGTSAPSPLLATMKSEADPRHEAVSARASALRDAVQVDHSVPRPPAAEPAPERAEEASQSPLQEDNDEDDDW
jgi:serine/threonine protein kinase